LRHIIAILLQNEAGALTRVAGLFSTRGYNIESLSVAATQDPTVSRLTLVTQGSDAVIQQIASQLLKLVDVVGVEDMTSGEHLERELALVKVEVPPLKRAPLDAIVARAGARTIAETRSSLIIELTSSELEVSRFIEELAGAAQVREVVRSGALGIGQGAGGASLQSLNPGGASKA
jgi:acetolactate synthase-1/3 small subunit